MNKVNLLIIGTQKAGTTSLYRYMSQHPDIVFSRVKEVPYFVDDYLYAKGTDYYAQFFPAVSDGARLVSGYVHMLVSPDAPARVWDYNPDMKFIVLLRHPVARAWSAYQYARQMGWEKDDIDFPTAVGLESRRRQSDDPRTRFDTVYAYNGLYSKHLQHWMQVFPSNRFLILRSDDLRDDAQACLVKIWRFLGVREGVTVDTSTEYNQAGRTRVPWLTKILFDRTSAFPRFVGRLLPARLRIWIRSHVFTRLQQLNTAAVESTKIPEDVMELLTEYYRADMRDMERKFGISF